MKRILCIILLMSCLLTICSCATVDKVKNKITGNDDEEEVDHFASFENAIAKATSSAVIVDVSNETALGTLTSKYEIYYSADGTATIKYEYERFLKIGEGDPNETKTTEKGTVYRDKDGNYSEDVGIDFSAVTAAAAFNLAPFKETANINEAGDVLKVTIPKINTADVLGSQFSSDVNLEMTIRSESLVSAVLTYQGGSITYTYSVE